MITYIKSFLYNKKGMGTVEIIIIIAVLVALALLFKDFVMELAKGIFEKIKENANSAVSGL